MIRVSSVLFGEFRNGIIGSVEDSRDIGIDVREIVEFGRIGIEGHVGGSVKEKDSDDDDDDGNGADNDDGDGDGDDDDNDDDNKNDDDDDVSVEGKDDVGSNVDNDFSSHSLYKRKYLSRQPWLINSIEFNDGR
mmetsp:Transcript_64920/g.76834  ORF Transcript_64920/g.76834 Transcript_64920/m.76834 type:complete len:134 (-) Transcript_64920:715-1116(-)